jgi:hypothetical protein
MSRHSTFERRFPRSGVARAASDYPSSPETSILPHTVDHGTDDDADNPIDHVIAISIDGVNPDAIKKLGPSTRPGLSPADAGGRLHPERSDCSREDKYPAQSHRDADRPAGRRKARRPCVF